MSATRGIVGAAALVLGAGAASGGLVTASWLNAASGTWDVGTNWSTNPNFPNNGTPAGETYHAVIDAVGSAYTVTLNSAVTVDQFTLNSANATVDHSTGVFGVLGGGAALNAGTYRLSGGTISGGVWTVAGGTLAFSGATNNILDGATVQGTGDFSGLSARVRLRNGASFTGDVTLAGSNSVLGYEQTASLASGRSVIFSAATTGGKLLSVEGDNTLTIDNGATVRGRNGTIRGGVFNGSGTQTIVNNGLISADFAGTSIDVTSLDVFTNNGVAEAVNGAILDISATSWTNSAAGTVRAVGAGSTLTLGGAWSNAGAIEVTNGTLNLGGTFATASLGGLSRTGGAVNITGAMDNTGGTLALNAATGTLVLSGGSITGGTATESGGARLGFSSSTNNALIGVTVQGTGEFSASSARVRLRNGSVFTGDVTLSGSNSVLAYEQTASLASGRSVIFDAATSGGKFLSIEGANTLTIDAGATVRGRNGTIRGSLLVGGSVQTLVNNGLVSSDFNGPGVDIESIELFTNNGVVEAINGSTGSVAADSWSNGAAGTLRANGAGSTLTLGGDWSNAGTLEVTDGTLNLGGTFASTSVSGLSRTGGTVNITGAMDNAGETLAINAATGTLVLSGGSITGGTATESGGARLAFSGSGNNALIGATVQGSGEFSASSARVRLRSGSEFTGDVTLSGNNSILAHEQTASLASGRSVIFDAATIGGKFLSVEGANTLTIESGATVRGRNGTIRGSLLVSGFVQTLVNNGLVSSDFNGAGIDIQTIELFTNNGVVEAINGSTGSVTADSWTNGAAGTLRANGAGSTLTLGGAWSNAGALEVTDGTLNLGGTFASTSVSGFNRTGGAVNITGAMDNTGETLAINAATGTLVLSGGSITGGTATESGGARLAFSGSGNNALVGVTVQGTGDFSANSARVRLRSGSSFTEDVTLSGSSSVLGYEQTASLASGRTVQFDTATSVAKFLTVEGTNTLTIDAGATVRGRNGTIRGATLVAGGTQTVVNNGLILAEVAGSVTISNLASFTNNGTLAAAGGGTLALGLGSAFDVAGSVEARPGGTILFSNGIGTVGQAIEVQLGGALTANYGRLNITAATTLNGDDLAITTVNGFSPDWGDSFAIMSFNSGAVTGDFSTLALPTLADTQNLRWFTTETDSSLTIGVRHTADVNRDNSINFADLNIIVSNFNTNGGASMGDVDEDGFIGFADLNRVLSFFNTSAPVNSVPAPGGAALLALAGLAGARRRR